MHKEIKIITNFLSKEEIGLLKEICRERQRDVLFATPFQRFGFSGAKLLLVYFGARPQGLPYLVKISNVGDVKKEFKSVGRMRDLVEDCRLEEHKIFEFEDRAALLYMHKGTDNPQKAEEPLSFQDVLYNKKTANFSEKQLESTLYEVYNKLTQAHKTATHKQVDLEKHYLAYFRKDKSNLRIRQILGDRANITETEFLGTNIINPLYMRKALPKTVDVAVGKVHGDLHPTNIILDRLYNPHIIDFAWANEDRDVLLDYVLIENSIRFMHFPRRVNLDEQRKVDEILLEEDGWEHINSIKFSVDETKRVYRRLCNMIGAIRRSARRTLGDNFSMSNYLTTQFIVLYGLMRFETYEPYSTTRNLGMIANRIVHR